MKSSRLIGLALAAFVLIGCEALVQSAAVLDETLYQIVPIHPVTGRPVPNLISEDQEVRQSADRHAQAVAAAQREGTPVDPPGERLAQLQRVFSRLVAVAHRQNLPWQVHLIDHPKVNAFTTGGGYVYVYEGLFGNDGLVANEDDEELAAVLAHEIAHVTMLHALLRETWVLVTKRAREDPFYTASFTTEQEADADRLGVLYMALAGYNPRAAARVWERAHKKYGSNPGKAFYLHSHPLHAERTVIVRDAGAQVTDYYIAGERNPAWAEILVENPLFPRTAETAHQPGVGVLRALEVGLSAKSTHERAKDEARRRETAAYRSAEYQSTLVKLLEAKAQHDNYGRPMIYMRFQNGAIYDVGVLGLRVIYLSGETKIAQDLNCGGAASITAGQSVWLTCPYYDVPNTTAYQVEITGVTFR